MEQRTMAERLDSRRPQERPWNPGCSMKTLNLCMEVCPSLTPFLCSRSPQTLLCQLELLSERLHPWFLLLKSRLL
jgi:hypothetical protein